MLSSLCLQIALHFHLHLTPFIIFSQIACFALKYYHIHLTYRVILLTIHLISIVVECVRLFLGYYGNLREKIPALSGFWIASVILQTPIYIFLAVNPEILPLPLERFVYGINIIFLTIEIVSSSLLTHRLADYQMQQFRAALHDQKTNLTHR